MKLRELEKEFVRKGVRYTQLKKEVRNVGDGDKLDGIVLYRCEDLANGYCYFEVFKPKISPKHPMDDGDYDFIEVYPSNEAFGVWAWCCSSVESLNRVLKDKFGIECDIDK